MQASKPGKFLARPLEWGVSEKGPNNLPAFTVKWELTAEWQNEQWCDTESGEIFQDVYLFQKNRSPNKFAINSLIAALGWDGRSFASLAETDWGACEVQLNLENETYDGKTRLKVKYLNPRDYVGGGAIQNDPQAVQSLDAKYGSHLRAIAPAAKTPAKTAARTAKQAANDAWARFKGTKTGTPDALVTMFKSAVKTYFGERDKESIGAEEWDKFAADGFIKAPDLAAAGSAFDDSDIPF